MSSALPRVVLIVFAVIYGVLGLAFLFFTDGALALLPLNADSSTASTEIAAVYGGLEVSLALIFAWGAWQPRHRQSALMLAAVTFAGLAIGRSIGMIQFPPVSAYSIVVVVLEYIGLLFSVLGLWKENQAPTHVRHGI